jgi:hypothetical protein
MKDDRYYVYCDGELVAIIAEHYLHLKRLRQAVRIKLRPFLHAGYELSVRDARDREVHLIPPCSDHMGRHHAEGRPLACLECRKEHRASPEFKNCRWCKDAIGWPD